MGYVLNWLNNVRDLALLFVALTLLCLLLSFVLFCINVLLNLYAKDPLEFGQVNGRTMARIAMFFVFTITVGLTINIFNSLISEALKTNLQNPATLFYTSAALFLLVICDYYYLKHNKTKKQYLPIHLKLFGTLFVFLLVMNVHVVIPWKKVPELLLYANISLIMLYSIVLFFEILASFVKPQNKLVEQELSGKKCCVTFLSVLRADKKLRWKDVYEEHFKLSPLPDTKFNAILITYMELFQEMEIIYEDMLTNPKISFDPQQNPIEQVTALEGSDSKRFLPLTKSLKELKLTLSMKNTFSYFNSRFNSSLSETDKPGSMKQIANEMALIFGFHPWEMTIRCIHEHIRKKTLSDIVIVVSGGSNGTINSVPCMLRCLDMAFGHFDIAAQLKVAVLKKSFENHDTRFEILAIDKPDEFDLSQYDGIDFGNYEETSDALLQFLNHPTIKQYGLHNVFIDVTGGQKPASVAGALAATVLDVKNQYVDTNTKQVKGYDFAYVDPTKTY